MRPHAHATPPSPLTQSLAESPVFFFLVKKRSARLILKTIVARAASLDATAIATARPHITQPPFSFSLQETRTRANGVVREIRQQVKERGESGNRARVRVVLHPAPAV